MGEGMVGEREMQFLARNYSSYILKYSSYKVISFLYADLLLLHYLLKYSSYNRHYKIECDIKK